MKSRVFNHDQSQVFNEKVDELIDRFDKHFEKEQVDKNQINEDSELEGDPLAVVEAQEVVTEAIAHEALLSMSFRQIQKMREETEAAAKSALHRISPQTSDGKKNALTAMQVNKVDANTPMGKGKVSIGVASALRSVANSTMTSWLLPPASVDDDTGTQFLDRLEKKE